MNKYKCSIDVEVYQNWMWRGKGIKKRRRRQAKHENYQHEKNKGTAGHMVSSHGDWTTQEKNSSYPKKLQKRIYQKQENGKDHRG